MFLSCLYCVYKYDTFVNCKVYDIQIMRMEVNVLYCRENSVPKRSQRSFSDSEQVWAWDFRECLSVLRRCGERSDRKTRLHGGCVCFCCFWGKPAFPLSVTQLLSLSYFLFSSVHNHTISMRNIFLIIFDHFVFLFLLLYIYISLYILKMIYIYISISMT